MKWTVRNKLIGGFGFCIAIIVTLLLYNQSQINRLKEFETKTAQHAKNAIVIEEAYSRALHLNQIVADALIYRFLKDNRREWELTKIKALDDIATIQKIVSSDNGKAWAKESEAALKAMIKIFEGELMPLFELEKNDELTLNTLHDIHGVLDDKVEEMSVSLRSIAVSQENEMSAANKQFDTMSSGTIRTTLILGLIGIFGILIAAMLIIRAINNANKVDSDVLEYQSLEIEKLSHILTEMAGGNLAVSYATEQSNGGTFHVSKSFTGIADGLQATLRSLNDILSHVAAAVDQVSDGSRRVTNSSRSLSDGVTDQSNSFEEVSASLTQLSAMTKQNSINAVRANQLATGIREVAENGNNQMGQMLTAMDEVNESSSRIYKIIKTIDEIAFQTNLLALNAAVEAARAGVHGKGFAVVAEEVRILAQRSTKAARETADMIEGSVKRVEISTKIANQTAQALEDIISSVTEVTELVGEIAAASDEQSQGIGQAKRSLVQIDRITQTNAAIAEKITAASEQISGQTVQLKQMLTRFQMSDNNSNIGIATAPAKNARYSGNGNGSNEVLAFEGRTLASKDCA